MKMKASVLVQEIPEDLRTYADIFIRSGEYKDSFAPPAFIQDVVWLAKTKGSTEVSEAICAQVNEWLSSREALTDSAKKLIEDVLEKCPIPSKDDSLHGAMLPAYVVSEWFRLLSQPWSHMYETAIESGNKWLREN
jgi:hypothetical protein